MKEADHGAGSRTNTARRRRRNIFDFSDKERKEMLKEVCSAERKLQTSIHTRIGLYVYK